MLKDSRVEEIPIGKADTNEHAVDEPEQKADDELEDNISGPGSEKAGNTSDSKNEKQSNDTPAVGTDIDPEGPLPKKSKRGRKSKQLGNSIVSRMHKSFEGRL